MTQDWREHADAVDEYRAAAHWYESKRPRLGEMFMDAVDAAAGVPKVLATAPGTGSANRSVSIQCPWSLAAGVGAPLC